MAGQNTFDIWSGWHCFGSWALSDIVGWKIAIVCGIVWELLDMIYSFLYVKGMVSQDRQTLFDKVWDKRGFSFTDIICDMVGVSGSVFLIK